MNVLVVGQGGREHALVKALSQSPTVRDIHALPGSDGMADLATCHAIDWQNFSAVFDLVQSHQIQLTVIGPEVPLAGGLSDALRSKGLAVIGPSCEAAQLESSKIYSKEFMVEAGVPTARYKIVSSVEETEKAAEAFVAPYVLKADGLAAGKGVFICKTRDGLLAAARALFVDRELGAAGSRALLEEFQPGYEISHLVLTNGASYEPFPLAQDHKRLLDGDEGPNTGGMGVVAPMSIDAELRSRIDREVVAPVLANMQKRGFLYRGVLYIGLMITADGPSVLEFNTRFGDPEAQVILPLLDGDWGQVFHALAQGELLPLNWKPAASCCVVLAAEGYPDDPVKGATISGLTQADSTSVRYFLHAGAKKTTGGEWQTSGGRVLNSIGIGRSIKEAIQEAYAQAEQVKWKGMQMRRDIGAKVLDG